jgi:Clostridium epsilon toxin ETX/Bacillus mosquitocidal toxin MTX2
VEWERVEYDLAPGNVKITQSGPPHVSVSNIATNNTAVEQSDVLKMVYVSTNSTSFKTTTTLKLGAKTTLTTGIPKIVEGKVEISGELSQGLEWNTVDTKSNSIDVTLTVRVPAQTNIIGRCVWKISTINIPFNCVGSAKFNKFDHRLPIHIEGVYAGTQSHDVETMWTDIPKDHEELRNWRGAERPSF